MTRHRHNSSLLLLLLENAMSQSERRVLFVTQIHRHELSFVLSPESIRCTTYSFFDGCEGEVT